LVATGALLLCASDQVVAQQSNASTYYLNLSQVDFPREALINSTFYVSGLLNYSLPPPISAQSTRTSEWFISARIYNATSSPPTNGTFLAASNTQEVSGTGAMLFTIRLRAAPYEKTMGFTLYAMYQAGGSVNGAQPTSGPRPGSWQYTHASTSRLVIWIKSSRTGHVIFKITNSFQVPITIDSYLQYQTGPSGQLLLNVTGLQWHIISVPAIILLAPGKRAVFLHWQDGSNLTSRDEYMDQDKTLIATYTIQFLLTVDNNRGSGWYDNGTLAQITADRGNQLKGLVALIGFEPVFTGWTGDVKSTNSTLLIQMNGPVEITAVWKAEFRPSPLKLVVMVALAILAATILYEAGRMAYHSKHEN
jgi:hypothetical protein